MDYLPSKVMKTKKKWLYNIQKLVALHEELNEIKMFRTAIVNSPTEQ